MIYAFENLRVWQKSRKFVTLIYAITDKFPKTEKYGVVSQMQRASMSASNNLAEGSCRWSKKEQARFYEIAYGSLIEVLNQMILSVDLEFIPESVLLETRPAIEELSWMINSLRKAAWLKS